MMGLGLAFLVVASLTKKVIGGMGRIVQLIATLAMGYVAYLFFKNIRALFTVSPDILFAPEHAVYKKNIFAGCCLCAVLFALVLYSTYTVFF
jgi:hypothetical protein